MVRGKSHWRWLIFAVVVVPFAAMLAEAQPPAPEGKASEGKNGVSETSTSAERAKLQADLLLLLKRISAAPAPSPYPSPPPKTRPDVPEGSRVDAIREGMNLFRDNDFEAARRAFQLIDPTALGREDRAFVRYMLACCLRRLGKTAEAEPIYREVANSPDDEFLANCAIWQLSLIRSDQELQLQLEQLRARAKSK